MPVTAGRGPPIAWVSPKSHAASPSIDGEVIEFAYDTVDWKPPEGGRLSEALYEDYALQSIRIPGAHAHPTRLVQSAAMASVAPPKPAYRPHLPARVLSDGLLSGAQLESVIYAGEAHSSHLSGAWTVDATFDVVAAAPEPVPAKAGNAANAVRFPVSGELGLEPFDHLTRPVRARVIDDPNASADLDSRARIIGRELPRNAADQVPKNLALVRSGIIGSGWHGTLRAIVMPIVMPQLSCLRSPCNDPR